MALVAVFFASSDSDWIAGSDTQGDIETRGSFTQFHIYAFPLKVTLEQLKGLPPALVVVAESVF